MATDAPVPKKNSEGLVGQLLANRYKIEYKLGEGAMGAVYRAHHVKFGRPFAVKVLHPKLLDDKKLALRFEREAELAGRLHHPNVIGVVDVGETPDGLRYMVMDFAHGADLAEVLQEAPMPPERIIPLVRQLLEGLYHAHEAGLIHRDFKPENVIVERDDHDKEVPRIVDFGIAILREGGDSTDSAGRLTTNGLVLGTPHYMAPEQAVADPIDHRIDLFALGIVVYEMLSGMLPFDGAGAEVARANLLLDPPPIAQRVHGLEVDPLLEAFARRLMAKRRDHRFPTAKHARELLDTIERDRAAAAAALGVPLDIGTRPPQATQPMEPLAAAVLIGPPGVPAATPSRPVSQLEAPPMSQPQAAMAAAATERVTPFTASGAAAIALGQPGAASTARTEPLPWDDGARRSKRRWLIGGGVGLAAAGAIAAIALVASGGSGAEQPAAPRVATTATTTAPTTAPAEPPAPPAQPAPPTAPAQPVVTPIPAATDNATEPPRDDPQAKGAGTREPASKTEPPSSTKLGVAKTGAPKGGATKTTPTKTQVGKAEAAKADATKSPAEAELDVSQQWQRVGDAIIKLRQAPNTKATGDELFGRWRQIQIQSAQVNEEARKAALAELSEIRKRIAQAQAQAKRP
ncbi:MAG TPA: protein kinase [Kofleriaceae bacterium]|nr:protein kinase [Kofleriaceae bacterium]